MGKITLICGALHSDRSERINALWKDHGDAAILLTPTRHLARVRQEAYVRLNRLPGLWGSRSWELSAFTVALLEQSGIAVRMVTRLERRMLVRRVLERVLTGEFQPRYDITPGLIKHLVQIITQLKQAGVDPARFRRAVTAGSESADNDPLVAAVYEGYQEALLKGGLYDVPGLYWEAENACHRGLVSIPGGASVVLLDGFDDFTPSQQRFLESLSRNVSHLVIGLNFDVDPDRMDLFHLQRRWVEHFQKQADVEVQTCQTHAPETAVQYAAWGIFGRNARSMPQSLTPNLRIHPCADAQHEMEFIGRSIKNLMVCHHVAPSAIAVGLADIMESASMLRSIFDGFGIPYTVQDTPPLLFSSPAAMLMRMFDLIGTWETQNLVALVASPLFFAKPEQQKEVMAFPLLARNAGVVMGRGAWENALDEWMQNPAEPFNPPHPACTAEAITLLRQRVELLADLEDHLPGEAPPEAFARWCDNVIDTLEMEKASEEEERNRNALDALRGLLQSIAAGTAEEGPVCFNDFVVMLREGMEETALMFQGPVGGAVFCSGIDGLRGVNFSHVFLGGLNEGVLPRPAPRNALYSELDLPRLRDQGVDLAGRREHTFRERMLFYHALGAARGHLALCWRKQDRQGRDSLPSPYITEIADLFAGVGNVVADDPGPDCFVPEEGYISSPRDLASAVLYGKAPAAETDFPDILRPIRRLADIERERNGTAAFSIYDGVLKSPDLVDWLRERFGANAQFSTNALESYIAFPFNFFLRRVLNVPETEMAEGELDSRLRGALIHDVLQQFHQRYKTLPVPQILADGETAARTCINDIVEEVFGSNSRKLKSVPPPVARVEKLRCIQALQRYLTRERDKPTGLQPSHFEVVFGRAPRGDRDALSTEKPFVVTINDEDIHFSGIIDRIDLADTAMSIIDYKTGSVPQKPDIMHGLSLQLTLYAWAAERHLLDKRTVESAYYLPLFRGKPLEALFCSKADDARLREETAIRRISEALAGIRSGYFPPVPDEYCDDRKHSVPSAARYEEWRIQRKLSRRDAVEEMEDSHD